jgi:hypothetical protein
MYGPTFVITAMKIWGFTRLRGYESYTQNLAHGGVISKLESNSLHVVYLTTLSLIQTISR